MGKFDVIPLRSAGGVAFGASREQVRTMADRPFKEFKKSKFSKNTTDAFPGYHAYYSAENKLIAIEIFPDEDICVNGIALPKLYSDAVALVKRLDGDAREEADGITSENLGISIYAPGGEIESFMAAEKGYFSFDL